MIAKILTLLNALLALMTSALGFQSCGSGNDNNVIATGYGVPHATFEASGVVTNKKGKPLPNIRVTIGAQRGYEYPDVYTDEDGHYRLDDPNLFPTDSMSIVVEDESGRYAKDSVRVAVDYDRSQVPADDYWDHGAGTIHQDFELKKK